LVFNLHFVVFVSSSSMYGITLVVFMQVLLLMATALNVSIPQPFPSEPGDALSKELRARQQCIAEITEMIHVSSLEFCASIKCFCAIFF
jgi:hypothetical protein